MCRTRGGGKSIKATINKPMEPSKFQISAFVNGLQPGIDTDKMNQLLNQLEAEEFAQKPRRGAGV